MQEGCDKFCTYCVVPYTRGAEISRPWDDIVAEANELVDAGAREIVLLGQNVNAWAEGERGLAELIRALAKIDGLERIRYTTSHPIDMTDAPDRRTWRGRKADALPAPAGAVRVSNRILKAMNRSHTAEAYLAHPREDARGSSGHRAFRRFHRRLPRRNRRRFHRDAESR